MSSKGKDLLRLDAGAVNLARSRRQMTCRDLAASAGCSLRTVPAAHSGTAISLTKARDVAKALRVSLKTLCGGSITNAIVKARPGTAT